MAANRPKLTGQTQVQPPHVGALDGGDLNDGGCTICAECDHHAGHDGPCDCGHATASEQER